MQAKRVKNIYIPSRLTLNTNDYKYIIFKSDRLVALESKEGTEKYVRLDTRSRRYLR